MATPQFLTKNPNFLHEAFLDIYTADPRWLRLSDNFYENHDRLLYSGDKRFIYWRQRVIPGDSYF